MSVPVEVTVALIAAGGILVGGTITALTGFATARYQTQRLVQKADTEFLAQRDKLLWEQAGEFWNSRAKELTSQVELERTAREAETSALKADIALLKNDNAQLRQANQECDERVKKLEARLVRAGEQLQSGEGAA